MEICRKSKQTLPRTGDKKTGFEPIFNWKLNKFDRYSIHTRSEFKTFLLQMILTGHYTLIISTHRMLDSQLYRTHNSRRLNFLVSNFSIFANSPMTDLLFFIGFWFWSRCTHKTAHPFVIECSLKLREK